MLVTPSGGEQVQHKVMEVLKAAGRLVDTNASDDTDKPLDRSTDSVLSSKTTTVFMSRKSVVKPDEAPRDATSAADSSPEVRVSVILLATSRSQSDGLLLMTEACRA